MLVQNYQYKFIQRPCANPRQRCLRDGGFFLSCFRFLSVRHCNKRYCISPKEHAHRHTQNTRTLIDTPHMPSGALRHSSGKALKQMSSTQACQLAPHAPQDPETELSDPSGLLGAFPFVTKTWVLWSYLRNLQATIFLLQDVRFARQRSARNADKETFSVDLKTFFLGGGGPKLEFAFREMPEKM